MDITLSLINTTHEDIDRLIAEISKSNISQSDQYEILDIMKTIKEQITQTQRMGWI